MSISYNNKTQEKIYKENLTRRLRMDLLCLETRIREELKKAGE